MMELSGKIERQRNPRPTRRSLSRISLRSIRATVIYGDRGALHGGAVRRDQMTWLRSRVSPRQIRSRFSNSRSMTLSS